MAGGRLVRWAARHPGLYHNIAASPDQVWLEGRPRAAGAGQQLDGPRRADAWARITASRPSMAGYQMKTDRILPVLRLTSAE